MTGLEDLVTGLRREGEARAEIAQLRERVPVVRERSLSRARRK